MLFREASAFQSIELTREADGSLALALDGYWQFSSLDEHVFHEWLVDTAMVTAPSVDRVLILGGGDGLAARNALRYPVQSVTLVEIDERVLEMSRTVEDVVALNEGALTSPRLHAIVGDALEFVAETDERFDVIICDFPCPDSAGAETATAGAFDASFYANLRRCLAAQGVVSVQVSREPAGFWPVLQAIEAQLHPTSPRLVELSTDNWADFVLAGVTQSVRRPLSEHTTTLTPALLESTRIENRTGDRFLTAAYGDAPSFAEERL